MNNKNETLSNFIIIDSDMLKDKRLIYTDILLYGIIQSLSNNKKRYCFATNKFLAGQLNITVRHVQRCIEKLKKLNYINVSIIGYNTRIIRTDLNLSIVKRNKINGFYEIENYDWLNDQDE